MTRTTTTIALCLTIGLITVAAHAQANDVRAKIPFEFTVLGKTFPAGQYMLTARPHEVEMRDGGGRMIARVLANEVMRSSRARRNQVVFRCYWERCFLSEAWFPGREAGLQLLPSRYELPLAREQRGQYLALLGEEPKK